MQVLAKPSAHDRAADTRWRRLCAQLGIETSAVSADRASYHRGYAARRREEARTVADGKELTALRMKVGQLEAEVAALRTERALQRVQESRNGYR